MSATILDVLKRARARLAQPGAWCRGIQALDAQGLSVRGCSPSAVRWCAFGALTAESEGELTRDAARALNANVDDIVRFNDEQHSVEPVLDLYDATIARLEAGGAS